MGRKLSVSVHVGVHKTATTHLQHLISDNRQLLREHRIAALVPSDLRDPGKRVFERFSLENSDLSTAPGLKPLKQLLPRPMERLLISEENFIGLWSGTDHRLILPLYPLAEQNLSALVQAVAPHPVDVFLAVRDPCRFLWSCYSQILMAGHIMTPFEFFVDRGPQHVDWVDLVRRIRNVPGLRRVGVWPHELYPLNVVHVCRRLMRWSLGRLVHGRDERDHPGLSEMAMRKVMEWHEDGHDGDLAAAARAAYPAGGRWPAYDPFPPEMRVEIRNRYLRQLDEISALEGVEMLVGNDRTASEAVGPWVAPPGAVL